MFTSSIYEVTTAFDLRLKKQDKDLAVSIRCADLELLVRSGFVCQILRSKYESRLILQDIIFLTIPNRQRE